MTAGEAGRPRVVVVGLGPAGSGQLEGAVADLIRTAPHGFLRTGRHPAAAAFEDTPTFDRLYESSQTFDDVYGAIVEELVAAATGCAPEPVVYAVPGSPSIAERTVDLLRADARVTVTIVPALSFLDLAWVALGIDPLAEGVRLVDAADFSTAVAGERGPLLLAQCWSRQVLSDVKLAFPDELEAPRPVILHHLGLPDEVVASVDWWELDRTVEPDHLTSVFVPGRGAPSEAVALASGAGSAADEVARLVVLMDTLRDRCPWDKAQTHASLMPHLVEECYEVLDALAELDGHAPSEAHLEEELGDLLFQIVFHARLASEEGWFDLAAVARGIHDKLVQRHPHVFGDVVAADPEAVVTNWEAIKKAEKGRTSVTDGIPGALPALMLTTKLARKARGVGVDPAATPDEIAAALASLSRWAADSAEPRADDPLSSDAAELSRSVGELLFAVATLAQRAGVDAELALRDRALALRDEVRAAEGVPNQEIRLR